MNSPAGKPCNQADSATSLPKLWIYTNYDCNLRCSYCVAESTPHAERRAMDLQTVKRLVDEALDLEFEQVYFTGGEPFILEGIYNMLAYTCARMETIVLTNAMLFRGKRLERLLAVQHERLVMQVSLDGASPEQHDPYRGVGTWEKTVTGIRTLQEYGFPVRLSTTETPANTAHLDEICEFRSSLGIAEQDHFIRPLAKRGFSGEGLQVDKTSLVPELTVNREGVYWHPLSTDPDMLVSEKVFPLADALAQVRAELGAQAEAETVAAQEFK